MQKIVSQEISCPQIKVVNTFEDEWLGSFELKSPKDILGVQVEFTFNETITSVVVNALLRYSIKSKLLSIIIF